MKAIETAGPLAQLLDTRATIYLAMNQPDAALNDLHDAMDQAPSASLYFHLAQIQWAARDPSAALESLRKARADGLKPGDLHPLERREDDQLVAERARWRPVGDQRFGRAYDNFCQHHRNRWGQRDGRGVQFHGSFDHHHQ